MRAHSRLFRDATVACVGPRYLRAQAVAQGQDTLGENGQVATRATTTLLLLMVATRATTTLMLLLVATRATTTLLLLMVATRATTTLLLLLLMVAVMVVLLLMVFQGWQW